MSFSGHQNRERNGGNETISGWLKQLEEVEDFFLFFTVKRKETEEVEDFRHSFSVKGVKSITINVNL